jgi:hypothetical protein
MGVQCTLESEQAVEQLKALVVSLTEQNEFLAKECQELKRQREASSKESADYSTLLESQLETSNVSVFYRLQKDCTHRCRTVLFALCCDGQESYLSLKRLSVCCCADKYRWCG